MRRFQNSRSYNTRLNSKKVVRFESTKRPVHEIKILDKSETVGLGVRLQDLLHPLLFPIRRGSQDSLNEDDDDDFPGRKGWVCVNYCCVVVNIHYCMAVASPHIC